jgi:hypothetical protein
MFRLLGFATACALGASAQAQEAQQAAPASATAVTEQVQVSTIRDPALRPYRRMARGLDAWEAARALAPNASLRFELWNSDGQVATTDGLQLRIAGDKVDIALPIDADGSFVLPRSQDAFDDDADLVINRKKDQIRWRPRVRTPGVPENARRLGDLRLECEVSQAVRKEEIPLLYRAGALATGGICKLPMVAYVYRAPKPLQSAMVVSGARREALALDAGGRIFTAPLRNKEWDNDALIVFQFADAPAPAN